MRVGKGDIDLIRMRFDPYRFRRVVIIIMNR